MTLKNHVVRAISPVLVLAFQAAAALAGPLPGTIDHIVPVSACVNAPQAMPPAYAVMADLGSRTPEEAYAAMDAALAEAERCSVLLDLTATMELTLLAPCLAGQQIVIAHAGRVFVAEASADGALFMTLPMSGDTGPVDIRLADGTVTRLPFPLMASAQDWEIGTDQGVDY